MDFQNRFVSAEEASLYFSAADALILPYKSATQSGVIAMAYHYALPMVVTHHQGLAQPIAEDQTGEIWPYSNGNFNKHKRPLYST